MTTYQYCTPEWLQACGDSYRTNPKFQKQFEKLTVHVCFLVKADPGWGIERDVYFGASVRKGALERMGFYTLQQAKQDPEFILGATPQEWKKILRKENKFVADFMLGKITLEKGSKVGVLAIAPHSNTFVEILNPGSVQFPDEMSPDELESFRQRLNELHALQEV